MHFCLDTLTAPIIDSALQLQRSDHMKIKYKNIFELISHQLFI